jgi:hypothetical protein
MELVSQYARRDGASMVVHLATYQQDPAKLWEPARGGQLHVELRFSHGNEVDRGVYSMARDQPRLVIVQVHDRATVAGEILTGGDVIVGHLDDEWVCGLLQIETADSKLTGPFAARIIK